jgi:hypothetical protein
MTTICMWPCMAAPSSVVSMPMVASSSRTLGWALLNTKGLSQLPQPCVKGESICVKTTQQEYDRSVDGCKNRLHGRLVMNKGDNPLPVR